jgi:CBS domain-containing protein
MEFIDDVASILNDKGHHIWSISGNAMVFDAITLMANKNVGALVVLDDGKLLGIVSERDYTHKVILLGRSSRETAVCDIMSTGVVTIESSCTVERALQIMTRNRIRHLPVLAEGVIVGLVSMGDLVERIIREQRAALTQLEGYVIGRYPN